jgi:agmatine deiminase
MNNLTQLKRIIVATFFWASLAIATPSAIAQISSYMPDESAPHEGTWLQWPHHFTYGVTSRNQVEPSWIAMTRELVQSERVHIVVYNATEQTRIRNILIRNGISLTKIDFLVRKTDDYWVRDNGPVFVYDLFDDRLTVSDWGFNGWGDDAP